MKTAAIIPARGGSKGLPGKNIKNLCGKPLIAYTIDVAKRSRMIDHVVVSTDSEEVAEISRTYGAMVPGLRPDYLAKDDSPLNGVLDHVKNELRKLHITVDAYICLLPTHPFRTPALIDFLLQKIQQGYTHTSTVRQILYDRYAFFERKNGSLLPIQHSLDFKEKGCWPYYRHYGLINIITNRQPKKYMFYIIKNPVSLIDIDTFKDFCLAEEVILNGLFDFTHSVDPHDNIEHEKQ
jgi:CMP-N-acetylneuraminic acid synthetase